MSEEIVKIRSTLPDDMLEAELGFWRNEFGLSQSEYSAKRCEEIYQELELRRKSAK